MQSIVRRHGTMSVGTDPHKVVEYLFNEGSGQWAVNNGGAKTNPTGNLLGNGERFAATAAAGAVTDWHADNVTLTDDYVAGPEANSLMTRIVSSTGSAGLWLTVPLTGSQPYTLSLYAKSNGASVDFRMGTSVGSLYGVNTATSTIQRFTYTFTPGSTADNFIYVVRSDAGGDAYDLSIWGARLDIGSSALAYHLATGDLVLGGTGAAETNDPTWTSDGVSLDGSNDFASGVFSAPLVLSVATVIIALKQTSSTGYTPLLTEYWGNNLFTFGGDGTANKFVFRFRGGFTTSTGTVIANSVPHILAGVYDGTSIDLFMDGILVERTAAGAQTAVSIGKLILGRFNTLSSFTGRIYYAAVYDVALSSSERIAKETSLRALLASRSVTFTNPAAFILCEGDSISAIAAYPNNYTAVMRSNLATTVQMALRGVGSSRVATMTTRAAVTDAMFATVTSDVRKILTILIGTNDIGGDSVTAVAFVASLKAYCLARKAATTNLKIVIVPLLPRADVDRAVGFDTARNTANTLMAADPSFWDRMVTQDAAMWADGVASNAAKYLDGLHPTDAGHVLMEPFVRAEVQAILDAAV